MESSQNLQQDIEVDDEILKSYFICYDIYSKFFLTILLILFLYLAGFKEEF